MLALLALLAVVKEHAEPPGYAAWAHAPGMPRAASVCAKDPPCQHPAVCKEAP